MLAVHHIIFASSCVLYNSIPVLLDIVPGGYIPSGGGVARGAHGGDRPGRCGRARAAASHAHRAHAHHLCIEVHVNETLHLDALRYLNILRYCLLSLYKHWELYQKFAIVFKL